MIMRDKKIIRQELKEKGFINIRYSGKLQKFFAELNNKPHQFTRNGYMIFKKRS